MNRIVVTKVVNNDAYKIITTKFNDFQLNRITVADGSRSILDNIYVGKVKNVVKNINAAFIEIENGILCYLELTKMFNPIFLNQKKNDILVEGDEILVQVIKEVQQNKQPVVTTSFAIKEDHIILTHGKTNIGISSKIGDLSVKNRIKDLLTPYSNTDYGFVVRTSAKDVKEEVLINEINSLVDEYTNIINKANYSTCFSCIKSTPDTFICDIKEMIDKNVEEIVIEDDNLYEVAIAASSYINKSNNITIRHYVDETHPLIKLYSIESNIASLLKERVWLKSGANIVIQHTEALTVVDVNTSKSIRIKGDKAATILKINKEAAKEIAYQLSLRNIGGIIIIDFIDMKREEDKKDLLKYLQKYLDLDYVKAIVVDITRLNLVELTRKKVKPPLSKQIGEIIDVFKKYM
jgi:ribonuclease G